MYPSGKEIGTYGPTFDLLQTRSLLILFDKKSLKLGVNGRASIHGEKLQLDTAFHIHLPK
jgi:hypothetical protein